MNSTKKALLIGLSSRILVIAVFVLCSVLFTVSSAQEAVHQTNPLPFVNLFNRWDSSSYVGIANNGYPTGYPNINDWNGRYFHASVANPVLAKEDGLSFHCIQQ
jgi:hypothetical protein